MRKISVFLLSSLLFVPLLIHPEENISPDHKNWLENVTPIITRAERQVFLQLKTDRERDRREEARLKEDISIFFSGLPWKETSLPRIPNSGRSNSGITRESSSTASLPISI